MLADFPYKLLKRKWFCFSALCLRFRPSNGQWGMNWGREEVNKLVAFLFSLQWPAAGSDLKDRSRALDNKEGETFPLSRLDNSRHTMTAHKATVMSTPIHCVTYLTTTLWGIISLQRWERGQRGGMTCPCSSSKFRLWIRVWLYSFQQLCTSTLFTDKTSVGRHTRRVLES